MRSSGILMHITSLPGPYGVGTMGAQAFAFVDFLKSAGQRYWQILPLTPTGYGDSPYQSCSTFAGSHYLIDLDTLVKDGLLYTEELENIPWCVSDEKADFGLLYKGRLPVLRLAYERFRDHSSLDRFCGENRDWLPDFALFMALKDQNGGKPWYQWEAPLKRRDPGVLAQARTDLAAEIRFYCFVQYLFYQQWNALHAYAAENGISIIGDVPIYVPMDSVEVWREPKYFQLDENRDPIAVAGCPPDAFTADGQLWGNPLYRWDVLKEEGYGWWLRRLAAAGRLYDVIRIDHFRGFQAYWSIPAGDTTARNGQWVTGPGMDFIQAVKQGLPELRFIAEDLGYLTQEVRDLREGSGFPGMKVLQFAFDPKEPSNYLPHTYIQNSVCYTGTHDNLTMRQWFDTAGEEGVTWAKEYMRLTDEEGYVWGTIRTAFASVSDTVIVPMQDILSLGAEARMNFPGTLSDCNWTWRVKSAIMYETMANRILSLTRLYDRLGD